MAGVAVDRDQASRCCEALTKLVHNQHAAAKKKRLIEAVEPVQMLINLSRVPTADQLIPVGLSLPHSVLADDAEVCLITKDPSSLFRDMVTKHHDSDPACGKVTQVLGVKELKQSYREYETRRKLCAQYDLFLADERVLRLLPGLLGKEFFKRKKLPVPVKLPKTSAGDIQTPIQKALAKAYMSLRSGSCCMIKIGHTGMSLNELTDNACQAARELGKVLPKKAQVQALYLKTPDSLSLPLYARLPEPSLRIATDATPSTGQPQPQSEPQAKSPAKAQAKPQAKSQAKSQVKPQAKIQVKPQASPQAKPAPKSQGKPDKEPLMKPSSAVRKSSVVKAKK